MNKKIANSHYESQLQIQKNYNIDAVNALNHIPSELPRDEWVTIAIAFKAAGGDFDSFDAWSSTASNYKQNDAKTLWKSILVTGGIGGGTLFYIAKQCGYKSVSKVKEVDVTAIKMQARLKQQAEEAARQSSYELAQQRAEKILDQCEIANLAHQYLIRKRVNPLLLPWIDKENRLVLPVMDLQGNLHSLQFIDEQGDKQFLKGGMVKGHFYQIWSKSQPSKAIVICEGYATGVTLASHYTPDCSVVVAFNAGNLMPVALKFRAAFPDSHIIIAGDNDKSGVGQKAAKEAALAVSGDFSLPVFQANEVGSDFNDRWCLDNREVTS